MPTTGGDARRPRPRLGEATLPNPLRTAVGDSVGAALAAAGVAPAGAVLALALLPTRPSTTAAPTGMTVPVAAR